ncbi:sphingomyelinase C-like [Anneissia japonica]|uniref:sphingomyelinase C-like n=1 Tax=Anneissia japonica TaxID=1529436 RepID=UPI00142557DC|nr:sphingomyelinase C-like [Anneissia japonica]
MAFTVVFVRLLSILMSGHTLLCVSQACDTSFVGTRPSVWVDFECSREASSVCQQFGLEYICADKDPCVENNTVLCASPEALPLTTPNNLNEINVISYNVWELRYLYYQSGQRERTCRIVRELVSQHPEVDVISFNEVFMGGCFSNESLTIRDILMQYGYVYYTETVGTPTTILKPENGGVFIASRWPIIRKAQHVFEKAAFSTTDFLSGKGVMYVEIDKNVYGMSRRYHVFGTHMQAQERFNTQTVRLAQAKEMYMFQRRQYIPADEPVIYVGDLNCDWVDTQNHAEDVINALHASEPERKGELNYTYDRALNDVFPGTPVEDNTSQWLDYALYSNEHLLPTSASVRVLRPKTQPFEVCSISVFPGYHFPDAPRCQRTRVISDLSDHFPVLGNFVFRPNQETTTTHPIGATRNIGTLKEVSLNLLMTLMFHICLIHLHSILFFSYF